MTLIARFRSWLRATFLRSRADAEMDAELRFHIEARTQDLIRNGISPQEAARRARIEFGGIESAREECRETRRADIFESLLQDVRFAALLAAATLLACLVPAHRASRVEPTQALRCE
ncbi:MAG TPA: permease prefix domain 1-containing protein [Candidatus Acidoferrum sp.]|nr:permease prefix domain 1-containing protein [Candidatus Acidoferrum sp.]